MIRIKEAGRKCTECISLLLALSYVLTVLLLNSLNLVLGLRMCGPNAL